ncbi:amino acid ABC transporter substrate-binding protein [Bacillus salipaludis]|uniref:Amino acid ABC transporter substrate-binding protein n=1 Tax=Bacillus salipaludis TaxID=2547811 RepID=A0AA90TS38_9BACI|nr:amino acid ABC transporter substrate-binding protein [Bacillus salipaludis]MDQ6594849.1 amino acid ABC transporter substrate-binding protein [Bacillus salipaludis]MDQ6600661.1 amino acid ABC transporter substrate-binding protein [Bacillus salipaludis]
MKKSLFIFAFSVFVALVLTACGNTQKETSAKPDQAAESKKLLEKIKADGTIKIGTEGTYAPFSYHDASGKLTGFDIEIAEEVAKRLGVKAEFVETPWDGIFAGLDSKRFDIIACQVGIRPDRQEKYDFSDPTNVSKPYLIVSKDNNTIKTFKDLKGKKSAESLTSMFKDMAASNGAEIVGVEGFNQAIDLLISKRVDATINDGLSYLDFKKQQPNAPLKVAAELDEPTKMGIMLRKGNIELVDAINKALADMKKDGMYLSISKKYFETDVSK